MKKNKKFLRWGAFLLVAAFLSAPALVLADPKPPKNVISMKKARAIAMKVQKGKIKDEELEFENKIWIYSFEILAKDKKIHEINVDSLTGKIVEQTIETPANEAKEEQRDQTATPFTTK